jgi:hypothetical protein
MEDTPMKFQIEKSVVTLCPETQAETDSLEHLWRMLIDCNGPTLTLCPIGEYVPALGETGAQFHIEGAERSNYPPPALEFSASVEYKKVYVDEDCDVYCSTCNNTISLKKGDPIPLCCGKLMVVLD